MSVYAMVRRHWWLGWMAFLLAILALLRRPRTLTRVVLDHVDEGTRRATDAADEAEADAQSVEVARAAREHEMDEVRRRARAEAEDTVVASEDEAFAHEVDLGDDAEWEDDAPMQLREVGRVRVKIVGVSRMTP